MILPAATPSQLSMLRELAKRPDRFGTGGEFSRAQALHRRGLVQIELHAGRRWTAHVTRRGRAALERP